MFFPHEWVLFPCAVLLCAAHPGLVFVVQGLLVRNSAGVPLRLPDEGTLDLRRHSRHVSM